ncbi:hypothetical protein KWC22_004748 [Salmonella enterica]|uniref:Uncharacterized protein n=1 Tax=Salmonella enterica TaxID=28901 RepID=A0A742UGG7_SALER|nr:hypothetical protein [Salmonella enterica]EDV1942837.1 hypothetical protein [Salmonella enterica subsp. enterica serovar Oranienburg]EEO3480369.1 hypothetical protein [Salmonella enterica subsp. enterica serovar Hvittingfoss]EHB1436117.1 hypothetical protein [Salmonella enterica subsp. enterica serovar Cerro]EKR1801822.1 hypothetical protein [Salmonella enterica subsp. enterica serovar Dublin]HCA3586901.1 hypothetical protein [Salmonella enterica subsp. enterica serovar Java]HCM1652248.1 h
MNTQNVNVKTAASESTERWDEKALDSLNSLQMSVSNALLDYQRSPDKARLETETARLMDQLEVQIRLIPVATPALQQKVDEIAQMLHLMAQFAGTELRK